MPYTHSNSAQGEMTANLTIQTVDESLLTPVLGKILNLEFLKRHLMPFGARFYKVGKRSAPD